MVGGCDATVLHKKPKKKKKEPVHYYTNDNKLSGLFNKLWKTNSNISKPWML